MAAAGESSRDWARLPPELLHKIATHLQELPDLLRFRFVCYSWRSSTSSSLPLLSSPLPWLLLPSFQATCATFNRRFYSLSEHRIYAVPVPKSRNKSIFPSSCGLLVLVDRSTDTPFNQTRSISLINPITLTLIPLPPISLTRRPSSEIPVSAAKLFAPDLVVLLSYAERCAFFARIGASEWNRAPEICTSGNHFAHHSGHFFVIGCDTEVFDMETGKKVVAFPIPQVFHSGTHLVNSPSGELLLVDHSRTSRKHNLFRVFRLDESKSDPPELRWSEVKSIGDNVLFVDNYNAMCFAAADFKGCRGDCIYFVDHQGFSKDLIKNFRERGVWLFDMQRSKTELFYSFEFPMDLRLVTWFVPRLCKNIS